MRHRVASSLRGSLIAGASATALVFGGLTALAQQPPAPAAPAKPAAPKPAAPAKPAAQAPAAQKPAQQQAQQPAPAAPAQAAGDMPPLVFSPWTKFCSTPGQNGQDANAP